MTTERWNDFIYAVNNDIPKEKVNPPVEGEKENRIFNNMVKELEEMRKKNPKAAFWPVEKEE